MNRPSKHPFPSLVILLALLAASPFVRAQETWTRRASGTIEVLSGVTFGGNLWVAVGEGGTIRTSPDGITWTPRTSGTSLPLRSVAWGDGQFVAVGQAGTILTSADGITWTPRASGVSTQIFLSGVAHAGGRFVVVGGGGTIVTSTNGVDWSPSVSGAFAFLQSVTAGGGKFVAVGASGKVYHSTDGLSWTTGASGINSFFSGVTWFGGNFYAVGLNGTIRASATGQTWTARTSGSFETLRAVGSDGQSLVALGDQGTLLVSQDGLTWTPGTSGVTTILNGIGWGGGKYVIVGDPQGSPSATGLILSSVTPIPLKEALDNAALEWATSAGPLRWATQTLVTNDGVDAAGSAANLAAGEASVLETTVFGPATLTFHWKISAGSGDSLALTLGGAPAMSLSGEADWEQATVLVGAGETVVRWTYARGPDPAEGANRAWLDEVSVAYDYASWAASRFDAGELADPLVSGPDADPDGDALTNYFEFSSGSEPEVIDSAEPVVPLFEIVPEGSHPAFTFQRHLLRRDGIEARLEACDDLLDWQPQTATEESLGTNGMIETVRLVATETFGAADRKFYRLILVALP